MRLSFWPLVTAVALGATGAYLVTGGPEDSMKAPGPVPSDLVQEEKLPAPLPGPLPLPSPGPSPAASPAPAPAPSSGEKLGFREIWAYLMPGEESLWSDAAPITDLGLFDFSLDPTGRLSGKPNTAAMERAARRGIRTHLVIASSGNKSLLHLALSPRYGVRPALLAEISELPRRHRADGVQLDLEGPRPQERADLVSFIRELKASLPAGVRLSLALPAKTSDSAAAYVYADLAGLADRLFIMVYDQHWRGGLPGAIAELAWHERVLECARANLPPEEVVIGLPFYGRVWQREEVARAVKHAQARDLASRAGASLRGEPGQSPSFTYRAEVTAECWFEDAGSLRAKLESARRAGFLNVGFWRIGQEDPRIWEIIEREAR